MDAAMMLRLQDPEFNSDPIYKHRDLRSKPVRQESDDDAADQTPSIRDGYNVGSNALRVSTGNGKNLGEHQWVIDCVLPYGELRVLS